MRESEDQSFGDPPVQAGLAMGDVMHMDSPTRRAIHTT
jgi:hypothetical protein